MDYATFAKICSDLWFVPRIEEGYFENPGNKMPSLALHGGILQGGILTPPNSNRRCGVKMVSCIYHHDDGTRITQIFSLDEIEKMSEKKLKTILYLRRELGYGRPLSLYHEVFSNHGL